MIRTLIAVALLGTAGAASAQIVPLNVDAVVRVKEIAEVQCPMVNNTTTTGPAMTAALERVGDDEGLTRLERLLLIQHCIAYLQGVLDGMGRVRKITGQ